MKQVQRAIRSGGDMFMARLKQSDDTGQTAGDYQALVTEFLDVFAEPNGMPPVRPGFEHEVQLVPGARAPKPRTYRMSPKELQEVHRQLLLYLEKGWIRPSQSPFGAPILFVRKRDGSLRMCVDYRAINALTVKNGMQMPRIDEQLDQLQGAAVFSKLDLAQGYHQVRMVEQDIHKTAFTSKYGHFEFTVMPFGLCNGPATFVNLMRDVFKDFTDEFVVVYFDDILVYSKTHAEHVGHLRRVLSRLRLHHLKAKLAKCEFGLAEVQFLGFVVGKNGVHTDPAKVAAVQAWAVPSDVSAVRRFQVCEGILPIGRTTHICHQHEGTFPLG